MATVGSPYLGLDDIGSLAYVSGALTLVAYTNTPNSLGTSTVASTLTQPTSANGYSPITLSGTWSFSNGIITYVHGGSSPFDVNPGWAATGSWSGVVTGVAIIRGAVCRHFKDLDSSFTAANLKKLVVDLSTVVG